MTFTTFRQLHLRLLAILLCADCKSRISSIRSRPQGGGKRLMFLPVLELKVVTRSQIFTFRTADSKSKFCQSSWRGAVKKPSNDTLHVSSFSLCNCCLGCYEIMELTRSKHVTSDLRLSGSVTQVTVLFV